MSPWLFFPRPIQSRFNKNAHSKCTLHKFGPENACLLIRLLVKKRLFLLSLSGNVFILVANLVGFFIVCLPLHLYTIIQIMLDARLFAHSSIVIVGGGFFFLASGWSLVTRSTSTTSVNFIEIYDMCRNTKNVFSFYDSNNNVWCCLFNGKYEYYTKTMAWEQWLLLCVFPHYIEIYFVCIWICLCIEPSVYYYCCSDCRWFCVNSIALRSNHVKTVPEHIWLKRKKKEKKIETNWLCMLKVFLFLSFTGFLRTFSFPRWTFQWEKPIHVFGSCPNGNIDYWIKYVEHIHKIRSQFNR